LKRRLIWAGIGLVLGALLWLPLTSVALCFKLGTLDTTSPWVLPLAAFFYWREFGNAPIVAHWLPLCAVVAGMAASAPAIAILSWPESRRLRAARPGEKIPAPRRALSDAHGSADWMDMKEARALFPGPHPAYGGVVVGEAYRVDLDKVAALRFNPDNPATWGQGGKAPLLIDPCTADATHGVMFAGSGGYKTTALTIPTLCYWTGSAVVFDPSGQVGPMTAAMRAAQMNHRVFMVGPGLDGFNVLDWIDPTDPLAETHVQDIIERIAGESQASQAGENAIFKMRGKEMLICLLADLLWDPAIPRERKNLCTFRERVCTPEKKMKGLLADIHAGSKSVLARHLAGTLKDVVAETFSGIYSNANADTQWLSIEAYAQMVSGSSFNTAELVGGKLTVFVQIPMERLRATPELGRVVIGSLLDAVYRAQGKVAGRILFLLDEVHFLGKLKVLEDARDAGRKFGITMVCMWQSLGQLTDTWGQGGKAAWFNSCSWRMFAVVDDAETAEEVSKTAGRYTVLVRTQGTSSSAQSGGTSSSRNSGRNEGVSEQARELIKPDEVRTGMRADEAIIFRRGAAPLRCGRAIYFRRPELRARIEAVRYRPAAE
jgi:type IV secretion system protein VirD4